MFRRIVAAADPATTRQRALQLFRFNPFIVDTLLEIAWETRVHNPDADLGRPDHRSDLPGFPGILLNPPGVLNLPGGFVLENVNNFRSSTDPQGFTRWHHLIYAYMINNTGVYEIFRRVLQEFINGERLGPPTAESHHWIRTTEQLFYSNHQPLRFITDLTSDLRLDFKATFFNACWRMFGMDSAYSLKDNKPYPYTRGEPANTNFVAILEYFLWEVWQAIINRDNTSGPDTTDDAAIANRAEQLHDMLMARRQGGNIARIEFTSVALMDWFHLTLSFNSPIVLALRADASSPQDRLTKIAERVGMQPHRDAKSFFDLADPLARLLTQIETGIYNEDPAVPALYTDTTIERDMRTIVTHWSIATGHDLKVKRAPVEAPLN